MKTKKILSLFIFMTLPIWAHHFKGLPHFSYFENYPQIPQEEFLGQNGDYEYSLVLYDFQGLNLEQVDQPNNARLYLIIFNMRKNTVYKKKARLEILNNGKRTNIFKESMPEEESVFSIFDELPPAGKYSLQVTLLDGTEVSTNIPFILSSQKVRWGKWIALSLFILIIIAGVGSRKARIIKDRKIEISRLKK